MSAFEDLDEPVAEHEYGFHGDGRPTLASLSHAIQVWMLSQEREDVTVGEAALAFHLSPERIAEAVEWHYWMFLAGAGELHTRLIEQDGE
ncbi:hypothetical protein [Caulobacter sp. S45]|uniref:hypothetical protein n=1 Tax=Caulobacter sp. S45 TaxID=1641861 RepID=UPI0015762E73|nr:hypothetical protein [Caulobacter sp. S45]